MSVWVGPLGGMVQTRCLSGLAVDPEFVESEQSGLSGRWVTRVSQPGSSDPMVHRSWSCEIGVASPAELAVLQDLALTQSVPYRMVACDAQTTNLLTPVGSRWHGWSGTLNPVGITQTEDGPALRAVVSQFAGGTESPVVPVVPGVPATGSVYGLTPSGVPTRTQLVWTDGMGAQVGLSAATDHAATGVLGSGPAVRVSSTAVPPAGAVGARLKVLFPGGSVSLLLANPAITWGDDRFPWATGRGAERVVLSPVRESVIMSAPERRLSSFTYTVREVSR